MVNFPMCADIWKSEQMYQQLLLSSQHSCVWNHSQSYHHVLNKSSWPEVETAVWQQECKNLTSLQYIYSMPGEPLEDFLFYMYRHIVMSVAVNYLTAGIDNCNALSLCGNQCFCYSPLAAADIRTTFSNSKTQRSSIWVYFQKDEFSASLTLKEMRQKH